MNGYITVPEAGRLLGLGRSQAYALAKRGALPVLRLSERRIVVPVSALDRLDDEALRRALAARAALGIEEVANG